MSILFAAFVAFVFQNAPVQGIVLKGANDPVSKAVVELRTADDAARIIESVTTEADGRFLFRSVRPGRYRVTAARAGYVRPPMTITVAAGQPVPEIRLPMTPAGAIDGRVFDGRGEPVGNVEVQALKASYSEGRRFLTAVESVQTNDLGEYRLFWLAPGRYYVVALHSLAQSMPRRMMGSGFSMMSIGGGFFAAGGGDPALFTAFENERQAEKYVPVYFPGTANEQEASPVDVRPGADFGGVNVVLTPVRERHVRGFVVDGTTGQPGRYSSIRIDDDGPLQRPNEPQVKENGAFDLPLLPGTYTLTGSSGNGSGSATIRVGDTDIENLTIVTSPFFNLEGRLVVEGQANTADVEQLRLNLRRVPPPVPEKPYPTSYSNPRADGAFLLEASSGDFRVNVAPILNVAPLRGPQTPLRTLENAYVKSIRLGNIDVLNQGLRLERPTTTPLEIVIGMNPAAVEGMVLSGSQRPASDATVVLAPEARHRFELYKTTTSDSTGRFHFDRVPPGSYKVFAWSELVESGSWFDAEFMRTYESQGVAINPAEGETPEIRVPLP